MMPCRYESKADQKKDIRTMPQLSSLRTYVVRTWGTIAQQRATSGSSAGSPLCGCALRNKDGPAPNHSECSLASEKCLSKTVLSYEKAEQRRAPAHAIARNIVRRPADARAAVPPRPAPPTTNPKQTSVADDTNQPVSVTSVIDTGELTMLAEKYAPPRIRQIN
ncbi:hypothetical protein EVAR_17562_1 [Eumeta japonica]|uniref:Uncharacterized protein n=1 Tax=Eumeta variegata TaxID=151549 RepID=A0A4C1UBT0_EUMVA|nr:hypothetical protein EVAR_17562_1 [Eumeta japonica]